MMEASTVLNHALHDTLLFIRDPLYQDVTMWFLTDEVNLRCTMCKVLFLLAIRTSVAFVRLEYCVFHIKAVHVGSPTQECFRG